MLELKYICVGTGRCGTVSVAQFLINMGIPCSHERIFTQAGITEASRIFKNQKDGTNSEVANDSGLSFEKNIIAEASWMAVPFLQHLYLIHSNIIHVVRDPIKVILTFNNKYQYWHHPPWDKWQNFILNHCGEPDMPNLIKQPTPLLRNIYFVVAWNRWIEKQAKGRKYIRIRIESDEDQLAKFLGHSSESKFTVTNTYAQVRDKRLERKKVWSEWGALSKIASPPLEHPATAEDILNSPLGGDVKILRNDYGYSKNLINLKYIVTGTGRCGTVSVAKFLTSIGIPCSHERVFNPLGIDKACDILSNGEAEDSEVSQRAGLNAIDPVIAESSWMAAPFLNHACLKDASIIHVIRDPLKVILSWNNIFNRWHKPPWDAWHEFILRCGMPNISELDNQPTPLLKNIYFVIAWNRWIEEQAKNREYVRIRIESDSDKLLNFLGMSNNQLTIETANSSDNLLRRPRRRVDDIATYEDILNSPLKEEIEKLRKDYGYI